MQHIRYTTDTEGASISDISDKNTGTGFGIDLSDFPPTVNIKVIRRQGI